MMMFDPMYFVYIAPALLLAFWAQMRVKSAFAEAQKVAVPLSGAGAARHILDAAGLQNVTIEQIPGQLSDHYDPRDKVLRLSQAVYGVRSTAAETYGRGSRLPWESENPVPKRNAPSQQGSIRLAPARTGR